MASLTFIKQTGNISKKIKITVTDSNEKALLSDAYDESVISGKKLELISVEMVNDANAFIKSMTFGIGADSRQTGITSNSVFPTFFAAARVFPYLVVYNNTNKVLQLSGGTTPGGTELFSSYAIAASGYTAIPLMGGTFATTVVTAFYLHDGGVDDTWNSIAAPGIDIKTNSDPA